jgi:Scaffold protein Nfu/NifU N terminal
MTSAGTRDECRREIAASGLTAAAVTHLTRDALGAIGLEKLAPVKILLKRFFSAEPWTDRDDDALAELVGPGEGWWRYPLDERFMFEFGWRGGAFRLDVGALSTFDGLVVPEATPNPRTVRFVTPPIHDGPSRWYESAATVDDPRVARLFAVSDDVANVLVGPDFVAIGLARPDQWEQLLDALLRAVNAGFASSAPASTPPSEPDAVAGGRTQDVPSPLPSPGRPRALERAWRELSGLRADEPHDVERLLAATSAPDAADRQVAARLMIDIDAELAETLWGRFLADPSRAVRRAAVDAMVDAGRPSLRPLLERALGDTDAWTRWKALRGLVELGFQPSRDVAAPLAEDPDFRVRLEAARALRLDA